MLFQSFPFLVLMVAVAAGYAFSTGRKWRHWVLLTASYVFYGWANPWYLALIWTSTLIDYTAGLRIGASPSSRARRGWLLASLIANLGLLGFFKYHAFFARSLNAALEESVIPFAKVMLPVGISFYTFQSMAYTIDVFLRRQTPCRSLKDFSLYIAFFPQLVAGPIVRPETFLPQLQGETRFDAARTLSAFHLFITGLTKKILIGDSLSPLIDALLNADAPMTSGRAWLGAFLFGLRIYADFSGYSDMARGLARFFGFELPINFRYPYVAASFADFWRRWHISLSTWLRDYLYVPLGGNRKGVSRTYRNLALTMLLGGLWHGAAWNFLIWGGYQGLLLIVERLLAASVGRSRAIRTLIATLPGRVVRWLAVQYFVFLGWIIFAVQTEGHNARANLRAVWAVMRAYLIPDMNWSFSGIGLGNHQPFTRMALVAAFIVMHAIDARRGPLADRMDRWGTARRAIAYALIFVALLLLWPEAEVAFIYFQF